MLYIWWPGFLASLLLVLYGLIRFPRYQKHPDWPEERRRFAADAFYRLVWQTGLLFAALCFMLMRSTRLMPAAGQYALLGVLLVVMAAALLLSDIPVSRAVEEEFREDME